jgi:hypothetical protein
MTRAGLHEPHLVAVDVDAVEDAGSRTDVDLPLRQVITADEPGAELAG